jgi:menaquinone-dependent protoporphyrinogen oxidase
MRVLVTAASKHGSTEMIAHEVVRGLRDRDLEADFSWPDEVASLQGYDAVIIGSAIYNGHWMKPATTFIASHHAELLERQVWLFSSGPVGALPADDPAAELTADLAAKLQARGHESFPGLLDHTRLGRLERTMVKLVHAEDGDFRDWDAVQAWTKSVAQSLQGSAGIGLARRSTDE